MRICPFSGCEVEIGSGMFACRSHWMKLTAQEKQRINAAYSRYLSDELSIEELRTIQQNVIDAVENRLGGNAVPEKAVCRSCGAEILWVRSATSGTLMPLDAEPVEGANIAIADGVAHVLRGELFEPMFSGPYYQSHFASCPEAKNHRRRKKS